MKIMKDKREFWKGKKEKREREDKFNWEALWLVLTMIKLTVIQLFRDKKVKVQKKKIKIKFLKIRKKRKKEVYLK